jgi:hypothetical protein
MTGDAEEVRCACSDAAEQALDPLVDRIRCFAHLEILRAVRNSTTMKRRSQAGNGEKYPPLSHFASQLPSFATRPGRVSRPITIAQALREIFAWWRGRRPSYQEQMREERQVERLAEAMAEAGEEKERGDHGRGLEDAGGQIRDLDRGDRSDPPSDANGADSQRRGSRSPEDNPFRPSRAPRPKEDAGNAPCDVAGWLSISDTFRFATSETRRPAP